MTKQKVLKADLGQRLPGKVSPGSHAYFRKGATISARQDMEAIISRYEQLVKSLHASTPEILIDALTPAFDKSQEYVPVKGGTLANSGVLEVGVGTDPNQAEASITYGDADAWYAALVHEYVWLNHEYPTRAKY